MALAMMPAEPTSQSFFLSNSSPASPVPYKRLSKDSQQSNGSHRRHQSSGAPHSSDNLAPPPISPYPPFTDPSPVDSNGTASTETTEIEDDGDDGAVADDESKDLESDLEFESPNRDSASPLSPGTLLGRIDTSLAARVRSDSEQPQSVIHAPQDFQNFNSKTTSPKAPSPKGLSPNHKSPKVTPPLQDRPGAASPSNSTTNTIVSPRTPEEALPFRRTQSPSINTEVPPHSNIDHVLATPQAQTREEHEEEWNYKRRDSSLEGIPEGLDADGDDNQIEIDPDGRNVGPGEIAANTGRSISFENRVPEERHESIRALKDCLAQAWGLCISLSGLSSLHRNRIFNYRGKSEVQNEAWRSCWELCKNLYDSRDEDHDSQVLPTLELCRKFCKALFDARRKDGGDPADSVLRVSFELNNHLYNAHDRDVPNGFQERTLEFYLTLCHRMMKLDTALPDETDRLLRSCWQLVEMLFSLRQNNRDGKADDEDLLTTAIHACWELTDQFKAGWTQTIPTRTTPKASQTQFSPSHVDYSDRSVASSTRSHKSDARPPTTRSSSASVSHRSTASSTRSFSRKPEQSQKPPETPTTVFDDTSDEIDSMSDADNPPNILVLGPDNPRAPSNSSLHRSTNPHHWSSAASVFSESSARTSSTATASGSNSAKNIPRVRVFLVHVAQQSGFSMPHIAASPANPGHYAGARNAALLAWVKGMPQDAFGREPDQLARLTKYQKLVANFPQLGQKYGASPDLVHETEQTISYAELGRAMLWMVKNPQYEWLKELFKSTLRYSIEGALKDNQSTITA